MPRLHGAFAVMFIVRLTGGCSGEVGYDFLARDRQDPTATEIRGPYWCCDPDEAECFCPGPWDCKLGACEQDGLDSPDGGQGWSCSYDDDRIMCQGEAGEHPDAGSEGDWSCSELSGEVTCDRAVTPQDYPDEGGGNAWNCEYSVDGAERTCTPRQDGEDDSEPVGPGTGGGTEEMEPEHPSDDQSCQCIPGAHRTCDEPEYCNWGRQGCVEDDGVRRWGDCEEAEILDGCHPDEDRHRFEWNFRAGYWADHAELLASDHDNDGWLSYELDYWFNPASESCALARGQCVQDMWDLDFDGDIDESMGACEEVLECRP